MTIIPATINDHEILTALTKASKAYWGYSDAQITEWSGVLTITTVYLEANNVYKLIVEIEIAGYYSYFSENENTIRLDNLFVLPAYIGQGIGMLLMDDFLMRVGKTAAKKVILESEPNAEAFYAKFGFVTTGRVATSIKNRYLPVMELNIKAG